MSTKQYRNISQRQLTAYVNKFIALILVGLGRVRRPGINITLDTSFQQTYSQMFTNYASTNQMAAALRWLPKDS